MTTKILPINNQLPQDLSETEAKTQYQNLCAEIVKYNNAYYLENNQLIDDAKYDALVSMLQAILKQYPTLNNHLNPLTKVAGGITKGFKEIRHNKVMLSLDNLFTEEDVQKFLDKIKRYLNTEIEPEFIAEVKIDGLSLSLRYEQGELIQALTRGDGEVGEDVLQNVLTMKDIPKKLIGNFLEILEVRGEVYMTREDFFKLNESQKQKGKKIFASPRNLASGSLRQLDSSITKNRPLKFLAWGFGQVSESIGEKQSLVFSSLVKLGFLISPLIKVCNSYTEMLEYYQHISLIRHSIPYDIDGIVYKVNDLTLQERLGNITKSPRWAAAYKFPGISALTKLEKITIQVGRTGTLTPVAELAPVNIGGVLVSRATLHNAEEIIRKDIREGDYVMVKRAGEVIPQVVESLKEQRITSLPIFQMPGFCPICGSKIIKEDDNVALRCSGEFICKAIILGNLEHFAAKDALNIEGLGEKIIETFYNAGFLKTKADIFRLANYKTEIIKLEGFGEKSFENLILSIEKSKEVNLDNLIYALGIKRIGEKNAKILAKKYITFPNFLNAMQKISNPNSSEYQWLAATDGMGSLVIKELVNYFIEPKNISVLEDLSTYLNILPFKELKFFESQLSGKNIIFTGSLNMSRAEAKASAQKAGANVVGSISTKVDFVIKGIDAGTKLKKATELGLKIITEEEFLNLIFPNK